ncbi:MAG: DUF5011 domain-containing protein [Crocinitomicaceae bacterium]|nr:DUF5011 domain-containing protein [Crocinitomicaceae bacterium]
MLQFPTQLLFATVLFAGLFACSKRGCTDPLASNYNPAAQKNNGNCVYTPGIKLIGDDTLHVPVGGELIDEGAFAIDADGSKPSVAVVNAVNTAKKGNYTIQYSAQMKSGEVTATRKVVVAFDRSNWVGTWKPQGDCGPAQLFHPDTLLTFVEGDQSNRVQTTDMLYYAPNEFLEATVYLDQIDMKKQYVQYNFETSFFTAHGNMNEDGTAFKLTVDYDFSPNSFFYTIFPRICELVYTKVE